MMSEIERLAGKLDALASRDVARSIFGSSAHDYARTPVSRASLAALEAAAGFALPEEYRQWMLRIGGGAGPYYGLWMPADALNQIASTSDGSGGQVRDPADIVAAHLDARAQRLRDGVAPGEACITTDTIRGVVPICQQGCSGYTYILLDGAFAGCVFDESCDCIGEPWTAAAAFSPAGPPGRLEPPTFLAWMEEWLDRSLARVDAGEARGATSREARP